MSFLSRVRRAAEHALAGLLAAASSLTSPAIAEPRDDEYERWLSTPITVATAEGSPCRVAAERHADSYDQRARRGFVELPTRTLVEWTPAQVRDAVRDADTGLLRTPADLVEGLLGDDRVQGVLSTRTHGLLGLPLQFFGEPAFVAQLEGTKGAKGQPAAPGDWARMFPEAELSRLIEWGILLGVGLGERIPDDERPIGAPSAPRLRVWHPRWLRYQWDIDAWFLTTAEGEIRITPGDGRWILYCPYGTSRPWIRGAWRALAFAWVLKQFAPHDRARHSEVQGSPARVGVAPPGASEPMRRRFLADLRRLGRDASMVLQEGYDYKVVEATGRTWDIYTAQIEWADRAIAITLAGQFVTTEGTKGFSNGNIHNEIRLDLIQFTAESLATCLREQGVVWWSIENFGDASWAPWVRWDTSPPEDKATVATALNVLGEAISKLDTALAPTGKRVDSLTMMHAFGVAIVDRVGPPPAAPTGGAS